MSIVRMLAATAVATMVLSGAALADSKGDAMKADAAKEAAMKKDGMAKDSMAKDAAMKKEEMAKDSMAKDAAMKRPLSFILALGLAANTFAGTYRAPNGVLTTLKPPRPGPPENT